MVWAGIMFNGRTRLHVVANGTMTGQRYIDEVLLPHVRLFRGAVGDKFVFMDDNATCHRTLAVQDCLDSEGIQRLVWPARFPDLNPIENVWDALGRQVAGRNYPPTNKNTLIRALTEEWDKLPQQLLDNVVQNIDECEIHNGGCQNKCLNYDGGYSCECLPGQRLHTDGRTCLDLVSRCNINNGGCQHICDDGHGRARCRCRQGYRLNLDGRTCDESSVISNINAPENQVRLRTGGGKVRRMGIIEHDIGAVDSCSRNNGGCSQRCDMIAGRAICSCLPGYQLSRDSKTCIEIDACARDKGGCSHLCQNINGRPVCSCLPGYQLGRNGKTCEEIDACSRDKGGCTHMCKSVNGRPVCSCLPGFQLGRDSKTCEALFTENTANGSEQSSKRQLAIHHPVSAVIRLSLLFPPVSKNEFFRHLKNNPSS
ncbi:multiple epidermal growth factor-like domains protein 6 [Trichonephila clavipes]|nr:multiple epidermal growth factor-like domains protein 6 [Trichonephila clavipes]